MSDNSALEKIKTKVKSGKVIEILIVLVLAAVVLFIIFTSFGNEEKTASADRTSSLPPSRKAKRLSRPKRLSMKTERLRPRPSFQGGILLYWRKKIRK